MGGASRQRIQRAVHLLEETRHVFSPDAIVGVIQPRDRQFSGELNGVQRLIIVGHLFLLISPGFRLSDGSVNHAAQVSS
jgi:hypothetical protein